MPDTPVRSLSVRRRTPARSNQTAKPRPPRKRKAKAVLDRPATPPGWNTSDNHEITLRQWRGTTEIQSVKAPESSHPYYGTFRA